VRLSSGGRTLPFKPTAKGIKMDWIIPLITWCIIAFIYFAPAYYARKRGHKNATPIFILNLFLGWTLVAWVACLAWAYSSNTHNHQQGSK